MTLAYRITLTVCTPENDTDLPVHVDNAKRYYEYQQEAVQVAQQEASRFLAGLAQAYAPTEKNYSFILKTMTGSTPALIRILDEQDSLLFSAKYTLHAVIADNANNTWNYRNRLIRYNPHERLYYLDNGLKTRSIVEMLSSIDELRT